MTTHGAYPTPPPPPVDRATIVGGGLGGLAAALALRNIGINTQVYERREEIGGGAGTLISVSPNGMHALSQIHPPLLEQFLLRGAVRKRVTAMALDGTVIRDSDEEIKFGYPFLCIAWNDALEILKECLPADSIHLGHTLENITQDEGSVEATFASREGKTVTVEAPFLVAADGIGSNARRLLFGMDRSQYVVDRGRTIWRTIVERKHLTQCLDNHAVCRELQSSMFFAGNAVALIADPGNDKAYVAFTAQDGALPGGRYKRSENGEEMLDIIQRVFKDSPLVLRAASAIDPSQLLERRIEDGPVLDTWHKGRALLIGDAVHTVSPSIGQGANMVFEDAWELSEILSSSTTLQEAIETFERVRIPRSKMISEENKVQGSGAYTQKQTGSTPPPSARGSMGKDDIIFSYRGYKSPVPVEVA